MNAVIVPAHRGHAIAMAPRVRAIEVEEIHASHGVSAEEGLLFELERSVSAWTWLVEGQPACMFGIVAPVSLSYESAPWFLSTPLVELHFRTFARECRAHLPELLERHPRLVGRVDARYALSIRWLQWLGARFEDPAPWGVTGALFRRFELGA